MQSNAFLIGKLFSWVVLLPFIGLYNLLRWIIKRLIVKR